MKKHTWQITADLQPWVTGVHDTELVRISTAALKDQLPDGLHTMYTRHKKEAEKQRKARERKARRRTYRWPVPRTVDYMSREKCSTITWVRNDKILSIVCISKEGVFKPFWSLICINHSEEFEVFCNVLSKWRVFLNNFLKEICGILKCFVKMFFELNRTIWQDFFGT